VTAPFVVSRLGPPLADEIANWYPAERVPEMVARYRAHYVEHAVEPSPPLPGALDALLAVRDLGGRTVVVTSKIASSAQRHVDHLALAVDAVYGDLFSDAKAQALIGEGAGAYVGDHVHDMRGARAAGATSVGVTTGPCAAWSWSGPVPMSSSTRSSIFVAG